MSSWTTTVPNSVRKSAPVGQTSRQAASVQCLQTSDDISQRKPSSSSTLSRLFCSMKATWRHVFAPSAEVLSYDSPVQTRPSSGTSFHSLQATSHALQPMQTEVSVKNPIRSRASSPYVDGHSGVSTTYPLIPRPATCYLLSRGSGIPQRIRAALGLGAYAPAGHHSSPPSPPGCGRS